MRSIPSRRLNPQPTAAVDSLRTTTVIACLRVDLLRARGVADTISLCRQLWDSQRKSILTPAMCFLYLAGRSS